MNGINWKVVSIDPSTVHRAALSVMEHKSIVGARLILLSRNDCCRKMPTPLKMTTFYWWELRYAGRSVVVTEEKRPSFDAADRMLDAILNDDARR